MGESVGKKYCCASRLRLIFQAETLSKIVFEIGWLISEQVFKEVNQMMILLKQICQGVFYTDATQAAPF